MISADTLNKCSWASGGSCSSGMLARAAGGAPASNCKVVEDESVQVLHVAEVLVLKGVTQVLHLCKCYMLHKCYLLHPHT